MKKSYCLISVILLTAYLLQTMYNLKWPWLVELQLNNTYKQISGLLMLLFILSQWYLSILRMNNKMAEAHVELNVHRTLGVLAPVFLYFHSHSLGYNYLFLLSVIYLGNFIIGFLHPSVFGIKVKWFTTTWIICHVSLSCFLMLLLFQHIYISYWFE